MAKRAIAACLKRSDKEEKEEIEAPGSLLMHEASKPMIARVKNVTDPATALTKSRDLGVSSLYYHPSFQARICEAAVFFPVLVLSSYHILFCSLPRAHRH